jgi:hypothetical protein
MMPGLDPPMDQIDIRDLCCMEGDDNDKFRDLLDNILYIGKSIGDHTNDYAYNMLTEEPRHEEVNQILPIARDFSASIDGIKRFREKSKYNGFAACDEILIFHLQKSVSLAETLNKHHFENSHCKWQRLDKLKVQEFIDTGKTLKEFALSDSIKLTRFRDSINPVYGTPGNKRPLGQQTSPFANGGSPRPVINKRKLELASIPEGDEEVQNLFKKPRHLQEAVRTSSFIVSTEFENNEREQQNHRMQPDAPSGRPFSREQQRSSFSSENSEDDQEGQFSSVPSYSPHACSNLSRAPSQELTKEEIIGKKSTKWFYKLKLAKDQEAFDFIFMMGSKQQPNSKCFFCDTKLSSKSNKIRHFKSCEKIKCARNALEMRRVNDPKSPTHHVQMNQVIEDQQNLTSEASPSTSRPPITTPRVNDPKSPTHHDQIEDQQNLTCEVSPSTSRSPITTPPRGVPGN